MTAKPRVLIVEDEEFVRRSLATLLASEGYEVTQAGDVPEGTRRLTAERIHAAVTDLALPGQDGIEFLRQARVLAPEVPVVVLTGVGTVAHAVAAMKEGALDFLTKPVEPDTLLAILDKAVERRELLAEVRALRAAVRDLSEGPVLVGESEPIRDVRRLLAQVAPADARVLLTGESGTGKDVAARCIHAASPRAARPYVRVNCAAEAATLFESAFFGHRRGAFTGATENRAGYFAEAHEGTLALDEIGTIPLEGQAKLLQAIETGEYTPVGGTRAIRSDARILAITNEDLAARVRAGTFREDLFYRLHVVPIEMPPLRRRKEDLPLLVRHFQGLLSRQGRMPEKRVSEAAIEALARYDWPGNVRELRNVLERATILEPGPAIEAETVEALLEGGVLRPLRPSRARAEPPSPAPAGPRPAGTPSAAAEPPPDDLGLRANTDALQRRLLQAALERAGGKKSEAAALLGIDPRNLSYYLRKHGLKDAAGPPSPGSP